MGAVCPNTNSQDWKNLVATHGIDGAVREYIKAGYNIPIDNKIDLNPQLNNGIYTFNKEAIVQHMNKNPKEAKKVLDILLERYPNMNLTVDGLFDENNNFIELKPGERGMHMRNAFISAIAIGNEATSETIAHEFAHEYIQMYINHPMVKDALKNKTQEDLADELGKFFDKKVNANWFTKLMDNLLYLIRKTFGDVKISEQLAREYYKGTKLGREAKGEGYISYHNQSQQGPIKRVTDSTRLPEKYKTISLEEFYLPIEVMINNYKEGIFDNYKLPNGGFDFLGMKNHLMVNIDALRKAEELGVGDTDLNHAGIDKRLVRSLIELIEKPNKNPNEINIAMLNDYFNGVQKYEVLPGEIQQAIDTLHSIHNAIGVYDKNGSKYEGMLGYQETISKHILTEGDTITSADVFIEDAKNEINEHEQKKDRAIDKVTSVIQKIIPGAEKSKRVHKALGWLYDGYLISASLTGKVDSLFQDVFYNSLDAATGRFQDTQNNVSDLFSVQDADGKYNMWGVADKRKGHIDDYKTMMLSDKNGKEVKVTMSEAAVIFLMLEQEDTNQEIRDKGFHLTEAGLKLKGRNFRVNEVIKLSPDSFAKVINEFSTNKDNQAIIESVRRVMDYLHTRTSPEHKRLTGRDLEKRPNFYPVYYGSSPDTERKEKNTLEQWRSNKARLGGKTPMRIGDVKSITNNFATSAAMYGAYSVSIRNVKKVLKELKPHFKNTRMEARLNAVETIVNKLEDPSIFYSGQGEREKTQLVNELLSNFTIYTLGYNKFVVLKQTASFMAAKEYINVKYLKQVGWGIGGFVIPDMKTYFKSLEITNTKEGVDSLSKLIPLRYKLDESNPTYAEMVKWSPRLKYRMKGHITREMSETIYDMTQGKDMVSLKFPFAKKELTFSKSAAMEGIRVVDGITIMGIWSAVKAETKDKMGSGELNFEKDSPEYWEHIAARSEFITSRTQPTSDIINRTELSTDKNPLSRGLTMFSSATQQLGKLLILRSMEYNNNPTKENLKRLASTYMNIAFMTTLYVTAIDMVKSIMMGYMGDDEPEEYIKFTTYNMINNMAGYFHLIGSIVRLTTSRIDDQPWTGTTQHPLESLIDDMADASANTLKGKWGKALEEWLKVGMTAKGLPGFPIKAPLTLYGNYK